MTVSHATKASAVAPLTQREVLARVKSMTGAADSNAKLSKRKRLDPLEEISGNVDALKAAHTRLEQGKGHPNDVVEASLRIAQQSVTHALQYAAPDQKTIRVRGKSAKDNANPKMWADKLRFILKITGLSQVGLTRLITERLVAAKMGKSLSHRTLQSWLQPEGSQAYRPCPEWPVKLAAKALIDDDKISGVHYELLMSDTSEVPE